MHFINIFFWHQFYTLIHSSSLKKLNSLSLKCILRVREAEVLTDPYWFSVSPKWKKILTFYTGKTRGVSASWREAWNQAVLNLPVCLETKLNARCWFWNNYSKLISWQAVSCSECSVCAQQMWGHSPLLVPASLCHAGCTWAGTRGAASSTKGTINSWRDPSWRGWLKFLQV